MMSLFDVAKPTRYGVDVMDDRLSAPQTRTLKDRIRSCSEIGFAVDPSGFVYLRNPSPLHPTDSVVDRSVNYSPLAQIRDGMFQTRFVILNTQLRCLRKYHSVLREIYHAII